MARQRTATLRDVARLAGVSVATASRVLSGNYPIADQTRKRVVAAMRELDYDETRARATRVKANRSIALIVPQIEPPLISGITSGIEEVASQSGRLCLLAVTHGDPERERDSIYHLAQQSTLDAVVLVGGVYPTSDYADRIAEYAELLNGQGARLILCARQAPSRTSQVLVAHYDSIGGAYAITAFLISRGHRRIAFIGLPGFTTSEDRFSGYRRALADHGIEVDSALTASMTATAADHPQLAFDPDGNRDAAAVAALLDSGARFTAIVAYNDVTATTVAQVFRLRGLSIPADVSLVGFDDITHARISVPALTTVHLPHRELGRAAGRLAIDKPPFGSGLDRIELGTHVVVRDSVATVSPS